MTDLTNQWLVAEMVSDSGVGNGSTVTFSTTQSIHSASSLQVSLNGLIRATGYTVDLVANSITFSVAPAIGQNINIKYFKRGY